jgi:hypothetical protein
MWWDVSLDATKASEAITKRSIFFSAADRQMEGLLSQVDFERSLLLGMLFQPYLLIPDIYFLSHHGFYRISPTRIHLLKPQFSMVLSYRPSESLLVPASGKH